MILRAMLQRLYASLTSGPGLNARPHHSRQRVDLTELRHLGGSADPSTWLARLLAEPGKAVELPAKVPAFQRPERPESEWSAEQKNARNAHDRQSRLLEKLRDIAEDATDYYNDHGEQALFLGFPLLSLPPSNDARGNRSPRVLAPVALVPISLLVRRGPGAGVTLKAAGEGSDLLQPNPALLAWIEQQTGTSTESLLAEDGERGPWEELADILALVAKAAQLPPDAVFDAQTPLQPVPRTEDLPAMPSLLPGCVLGLFPMANPGLLRDTKWMQEQEADLGHPVKSFLSAEALLDPSEREKSAASDIETSTENVSPEPEGTSAEPDRATNPSPGLRPPSPRPNGRGPAEDLLVTQADPCQAEAVAHARRSAALVVHGPPGTGKSQTIANIIGDHLARGERVLFVCDKRTALDVVKYRLDSMGLGALCGVIHDPQRDRRDLYLGLRERLEGLAEEAPQPDPARELDQVNARLTALHGELRACFDSLHTAPIGGRSFHELCGEWLELSGRGTVLLNGSDTLDLPLLDAHRTDLEEILRRALQARWADNPFRNRLGLGLDRWLTTPAETFRHRLSSVVAAAEKADAFLQDGLPPLDAALPFPEQAAHRRTLADQLDAVGRRGLGDIATRISQRTDWKTIQTELERLAGEGARLSEPLDRELVLQTQAAPLSLARCNQGLLALDTWNAAAQSWTRIFAFGPRRAAKEALAPLALPWTPDSLDRARQFFLGLKARHLWSDFRDRLLGAPSAALSADEELVRLRDGLPELFAVLASVETPSGASLRDRTIAMLQNLSAAGAFSEQLRRSADRADALHAWERALQATELFTPEAIAELRREGAANLPQTPFAQACLDHADTLEEAVRLVDRAQGLPEPVQAAADEAALARLDWTQAEPALRASVLARLLRERLHSDPALARLDSQRIEAAFAELQERTEAKSALVRRLVLHRWQTRWRDRLLAATGSRLNSLGAALRQRLYVRGEKAMKLRQMIAAGAGSDGGDPLFDLCPVWMAAPATVAQIFPREALFDVVIFDEASQCRLEEALPVLLRGRRVVIAGDPKQLPPTRFFEQSLAESDDIDAETAEEVFQQQQSEAEDLLSAALNLDVQEAFLDVHYRSRNEALIGFSNQAFYGGRLQPIPGHPGHKAFQTPIQLKHVDGVYQERGNEAEAKAAADLVAELLDDPEPPSIGLACFNLNQRELILDALEDRAANDPKFAERLEAARQRRGRDSFEGLFVKNLENVQGDERDHIVICTTFGPDAQGKFRRNFGALSRAGGERRLNVLVTRAREMVHVLTSIPRPEYLSNEPLADGVRPTGRHQLYAYLRFAARLAGDFEQWQQALERATPATAAECLVQPTRSPSSVVEVLGRRLKEQHAVGSTAYWGNDGFCVDLALAHPRLPADVTLGVLADFTRYRKTPDPIAWERFRSAILSSQGWHLHRLWSPALFRNPEALLETLRNQHASKAETAVPARPEA